MNARYALINATRIAIPGPGARDGGREEKGTKEGKRAYGSSNNFFGRRGADKVSPRGAIACEDRQLSLLLLILARGRAYLRRTTPFPLVCLPRRLFAGFISFRHPE